jgi:hypothetical protein
LVISRCRETSPSPRASTPDAGSRAAVASLAGFLDISQSDDDLLCAVEGRALMVTRLDVAEGPLGAGRTPVPPEETLWLQWSWPGGHPDPAALDPAQLVLDALGNAVAGAHLVHHRSRRDRDGRVKGHARLLVRGPSGDELGKLAYAVERTVQQTLARTHRSPHEVRLRVVRDEGWLPRR